MENYKLNIFELRIFHLKTNLRLHIATSPENKYLKLVFLINDGIMYNIFIVLKQKSNNANLIDF